MALGDENEISDEISYTVWHITQYIIRRISIQHCFHTIVYQHPSGTGIWLVTLRMLC